jgi:hypothetical protein
MYVCCVWIVKDATTMNQSSTRTLSKSYFALPKYDVSFLVLAAAAAVGFFFFVAADFFRVGFFFFVAAVIQLPITGAITAASGAFHFRLESAAASMSVSISIFQWHHPPLLQADADADAPSVFD